MNRPINDIRKLFPGLDMTQFSVLSLLEDFFEGIIITDKYGRVLFVNEEQARIDDMPINKLVGQSVTDIYHVDDGVSPTMQCIKTGRSIKGLACYYRTCTGKIVNSIHNIFPLFEGRGLVGTICFVQDFSIIEQRFDTVFKPGKITDLQGLGSLSGGEKSRQLANGTRFQFQDIIGNSREFFESVEAAKLSARSASPVMLFGETGTGKELMAQSIHNQSPRSRNQYVGINCAAIPENLLEGILFGTSKGAFTGAVDKQGLFEKADGGTLFLDEINSMTTGLQAKLLRFLQERKIRRVGSLTEIEIDIKIISSVNQNPHTAIANGSLRSDLFYRLAVVFIRIPPLRERLEDLSLLIQHFLEKAGSLLDKKVTAVSDQVATKFLHYHWPGNVRELEHVIEGGMNLINQGHILMTHHLPTHLALFFNDRSTPSEQNGESLPVNDKTDSTGPDDTSFKPAWDSRSAPWKDHSFHPEARRENEIRLIRRALAQTRGKPSAAAGILGISPQLLNYKLKKYRIDRRVFKKLGQRAIK